MYDIILLVIKMNEIDKMNLGMWYDANYDKELLDLRNKAQSLCFDYNHVRPSDRDEQNRVLNQLFGYVPEGLTIITPFMCDYGKNIHLGDDVFINSNCYLMDCADITFGNHVFVGPFTGFYTGTHPLDYKRRNKGLEKALPIKVGDNCWFGANVSVMPGVTIGSGCVIGAGSVVTKDIPDNSLVAGVPAKVIKTINQDEEIDI